MTIFHDKLKILYEDAKDENYRIGRKGFAEKCGLSLSRVDNFCKICENLNVNASWMIGQSNIKYNFETRFVDLATDLSKPQMETVEQYVKFLKYSAQQNKNMSPNINLPE